MSQLSDAVVPIKYIGQKAQKHDNVNHTGQIWRPGETVLYPARYAKSLLVHTDAWVIGKKSDIVDTSDAAQTIVAASAQGPGSDAGATGSHGYQSLREKEDPGQTQSEQVKDRSSSTKSNARLSLE